MYVLEIIWETIESIAQRKNKCIIKGMIRRKYLRDLRKLFKYHHMVEK